MDIVSVEKFIGSFISPAFVFNASDHALIYANAAGKAFASVGEEIFGKSYFETVCGFKRPCKACAYNNPYSPEGDQGMKKCADQALCSFASPYMTDITVDGQNAVLALWPKEKDDDLFIRGIDLNKGLVNFAGNTDSYYNVLKSYYNVGFDKVTLISGLYSKRAYPELRIEVHGLKGTSYVIGATSLGDRAKELEYACRDHIEKNDEAAAKLIDEKIDGFLKDFAAFLDTLTPVCKENTDRTPAEKLSDEEIASIVNDILEKLTVYELEEAGELIERLGHADLPEDKMRVFKEGLSCFENYDYDKASEVFGTLL